VSEHQSQFPVRRLGVLSVLLLVLALLPLYWALGAAPKPSADALTTRLAACTDNPCVSDILLAALDEYDPATVLAAYAATNPNSGAGVDCHDAVHRLGEKAWSALKFDAWVGSGSICNFGYYHGFMVGAAEDLDVEGMVDVVHRLCEEEPLPELDLPSEECVHGFGHAVVHVTGSPTEASGWCAAFQEYSVRRRCNEGVVKDVLMYQGSVTDEDFERCNTFDALDVGTCVYVSAAYSVVRAKGLDLRETVCDRFLSTAGLFSECLNGLGRGVSMKAVGERFPDPGIWAVVVCGDSVECAGQFGRSVYFIRNSAAWSYVQCAFLPEADLVGACHAGVDDAPYNP
jgi:hypothetical protein